MKAIHSHAAKRNTTRVIFAASILCGLAFTACERKTTADEPTTPASLVAQSAEPVAKTSTFETARLGAAIDTFAKTPTIENQSSVKLAFAELDSEIAELGNRMVKTTGSAREEATAKSNNMKAYRDAELIRFAKAQALSPLSPPADSRSGAQKMKDAAAKAGNKIEDGAQKVGKTLEKAAKNTGEAIDEATH